MSETTEVGRLPLYRRLLWWVALTLPPILYLGYVMHYSLNVPFGDDWNTVPLADAAIHGHLSFSMLWAQHNENRMLGGNIFFVLFGRFDHLNTQHIMFLSAALFIISYFLYVLIYRSYSVRPITIVPLILVGSVWFSIEDFENSLWSFQLAWYLIVFLLMAMLFVLSRRPLTPFLTVIAGLLATMASFTSLQGLLLWPVGLLCIAWRMEKGRRAVCAVGAWILAMVAVTALYFRGFNFSPAGTGGGSIGYSLHHPRGMVQYALAAIGNVFPTTATTLQFHELLGLLITVAAVVVVVLSALRWSTRRQRLPLPAALILFGFLFDSTIAVGRLSLGIDESLSSRYTMANLLVLIGIATFVFGDAPLSNHAKKRAASWFVPSAIVAACVVLALQTTVSAHYGLLESRATEQSRVLDAQTVTNLNSPPRLGQVTAVLLYVYPSITQLRPWLAMAREDQLSVFAPADYSHYRKTGPPR